MSEILRISSAVYMIAHILVLFLIFYETRYSRKKTALLLLVSAVPLLLLNYAVFISYGTTVYGKLIVPLLVIPSFIIFFIFAKHRDFRFMFTFCLSDTISAVLLMMSTILNHWTTPKTNIVMFVFRLISFPVVEYFAFKIRSRYFEIQRRIKKGWGLFTLISVMFYVLIIAMGAWPTAINFRPYDMPIVFLFCMFMPLMYVNIFQILSRQNKLSIIEHDKQLWSLQLDSMKKQLKYMNEADEKVKLERHNLRHRLHIIGTMLQKNEIDDAREYIENTMNEAFSQSSETKYCSNIVIDAVFSYYFRIAEEKGIALEYSLDIPQELQVSSEELSVVIANALENAITACEQLPKAKRRIDCRCITQPQFMIRISNPFVGSVATDENGIPISTLSGHGIGTRTIIAFCENNGAIADYKIEDNWFALRILIQR